MVKRAFERWRAVWHRGLPSRSAFSLLFALACVAIATLVRMGLGAISPASAVFAPYYSATLVAALVGGASAGVFATIAGAVAAFWLFVPPDWASHAYDKEQVVSFFLFAASSLIIIWAANSYRELIKQLREEQDRRQLLNHELAHRIRNTLATVQAVIVQTLPDQPAVSRKLNDRIAAMAATNDLLIQSEWGGARVMEILDAEFAPYDRSRFCIHGEDFECPSEAAITLALIFHELTTNAAKYGALSARAGRVDISWAKRDDRVTFDWVESGGPPPAPATRRGFGTSLLNKSLEQFDGTVDTRFAPAGLCCKLSLSLVSPRWEEPVGKAGGKPVYPGAIRSHSAGTTAR